MSASISTTRLKFSIFQDPSKFFQHPPGDGREVFVSRGKHQALHLPWHAVAPTIDDPLFVAKKCKRGICILRNSQALRSNLLEVLSKLQIAFEGKAQTDEKAQHIR